MKHPRPTRWLLGATGLTVLLGCSAGQTQTFSMPEDAPPAAGCGTWGPATPVGVLDPAFIPESSGLAASDQYPGRLYHANDSGDAGRFYVSAADGTGVQVVTVEDFHPAYVEALALGPCGEGRTCLFLADIGNNAGARTELEIVAVEETASFEGVVSPVERLRFRYPGGPADAESMVVHPNGDIFILTKDADWQLAVRPSTVYRIPRPPPVSDSDDEILTAEAVGAIEFTRISRDIFAGSLPTDADLSADGSRLLVLTYTNAFEFYFDLANGVPKPAAAMIAGVDYREIALATLEQQEGIAYEPGDRAFIYTTEFLPGAGAGGGRIMRAACQD